LKIGPIGCPETSVRNNHYTPRNILEVRRSHLLGGGSLQARVQHIKRKGWKKDTT